ncbi:MAG: hypothetical protein ABR936_16855 [Bacteroidota bacterium]|jgi:hypothetical protein
MLENIFTKENLTLIGVVALFVWRIIDFIIRQKKKRENDREKLAFEMAKYHYDGANEFPKASMFSYYLFYLDALEKNIRPHYSSYEIMKDFDTQLTERVSRLEDVLGKLIAFEEKLSSKHNVTVADLWERHLDWPHWWRETKRLAKNTFKRKIKYRSIG